MRVLLLSPYPHRISGPIEQAGDEWHATADRITPDDCDGFDMLVSFGYKYILKPDVLDRFRTRAINIHIAALPWNRGYHPNVWAWLTDTPHGVTIHRINEGIDTGPIMFQMLVKMNPENHTFATSYEFLMGAADDMFARLWKTNIRTGNYQLAANHGGSHHFARELPAHCLPDGWNTPVLVGRELYQKDAATIGRVVASNVVE